MMFGRADFTHRQSKSIKSGENAKCHLFGSDNFLLPNSFICCRLSTLLLRNPIKWRFLFSQGIGKPIHEMLILSFLSCSEKLALVNSKGDGEKRNRLSAIRLGFFIAIRDVVCVIHCCPLSFG